METSSSMLILLSLFTLLLKPSISTTILVDGLAEWKNPSVLVGDTIIFRHKQHYNLYIFQNKRAFKVCNFTQAILLTEPNSNSFTWHPSRPGYFYFLFKNGSLKACRDGDKLPIRVSLTPPENRAQSPELAHEAAPSPSSGGLVSSTPATQWRFLSPQPSSSPAPTSTKPLLPDKGGGIPFINSNPAVPLPTGETDAATIRPLPISSGVVQVVGLLPLQILLCFMVWMMLY